MTREEKIQLIQLLEEKKRREQLNRSTVFGIVCPTQGLLKCVQKVVGDWKEVNKKPDMYIAKALEPVLYSNKRFIIIYW